MGVDQGSECTSGAFTFLSIWKFWFKKVESWCDAEVQRSGGHTQKNILPVDFEAEPRTVHLLDQSDPFFLKWSVSQCCGS